MIVHNHGVDPSCRETRLPTGKLRGECMNRLLVPDNHPTPDGVEHYIGCPCGRCQGIRARRWDTLNLLDRLQETLNAKVEGDNGRLPERGMFNCADVQALINLAKSHAVD